MIPFTFSGAPARFYPSAQAAIPYHLIIGAIVSFSYVRRQIRLNSPPKPAERS